MTDRQAGLSKEEAVAKLELFASGKPDAKSFVEVASRIIDAAYIEPLGTTESEKSEIVESFVSNIDNKCLSGKLDPSYNPVIRTAPALLH